MAATDSRPVARKNTAFRVYFPILDADGDPVSGATGLDSERSLDGATFADCTNEATEIATTSGVYFLDLTAAEMNADNTTIIVKTSTSGAKTTVISLYPEELGDYRSDVVQWNGAAVATPTVAGVPEVDVTHWIGTAAATPDTAGFVKATMSNGTGTGQISLVSGKVLLQDNAVTNTVMAAGALEADVWATDSIPASAISAGAATKIRSIASGTSDSGSTTTMVDAARTEADTDYWKGAFILFTSGNILGQIRLITGFTPASDTITFAPATTQAVATQTYEILPAAAADVRLWNGTAVNALIAGRLDATVGAMQNGVQTTASYATGAIDATVLAADAIGASEFSQAAADKVWSSTTRTITALGATAVQEIWDRATSALTTVGSIGKLLVDNINATISSRATPAQVNTEVVDALNIDTYTEPGQEAPSANHTIQAKISYLYKAWRNRHTQTSTTYSLYNDDTTTIAQKATVSDDGTTFTREEIASGP